MIGNTAIYIGQKLSHLPPQHADYLQIGARVKVISAIQNSNRYVCEHSSETGSRAFTIGASNLAEDKKQQRK